MASKGKQLKKFEVASGSSSEDEDFVEKGSDGSGSDGGSGDDSSNSNSNSSRDEHGSSSSENEKVKALEPTPKKRKKESDDNKGISKKPKSVQGKKTVQDDDSNSSSDEEVTSAKKSKKKASSGFVEDEASESEDGKEGLEDVEDSDEENETNNTYEQDGFVVGDSESDEESIDDDDDKPSKKRRRRKEKKLKRLKKSEEGGLDEEDYALIKENLGMDTTGDAEAPSESDEDDVAAKPKKVSKIRDNLSREVFGDSESEDDVPAVRKDHFARDGVEYDSDDIDEFIVDDEGGAEPSFRSSRRQEASAPSMEGASAYQMEEAEELFGDADAFLEATKGALPKTEDEKDDTKKFASLLDRYEPVVLAENMMTEKDDEIRSTDMPERFQVVYEGRIFPSAEERSEESEWITDYLIDRIKTREGKSVSRGEVASAIDGILRFFHEEKLEPSYVARYCKEYWKYSGLTSSLISEVLECDIRWDKLDRKKKALLHMLDSTDSSILSHEKDHYRLAIKSARESQLRDYAEFLTAEANEKGQSSHHIKFKRPLKRGFYRICVKAGLQELSRSFTLSATQLGSMLSGLSLDPTTDGVGSSSIPNPTESPYLVAGQYTSKEFPSEEDVLRGARHIAACEVAAEPNVRDALRGLYRRGAVLITDTTAKGRDEIDEFHYCHGLQYLQGIPFVEMFQTDAFLRISKAEKEGLVTIRMAYGHIPESIYEMVETLEPFYVQRHDSDLASEWNVHRRDILREAVEKILLPMLESDLRTEMLNSARDVVVKECGDALRKRLLTRPFQPRDGSEPSVIAIWVGRDEGGRDTKASVVALDENGEVVDRLGMLLDRNEELVRKITTALMRFLDRHSEASVVVLNTSSGPKCLDMVELVDGIRATLQRNEENRFGNEEGGRNYLHVTVLKDDIASMYAKSKRSEEEFPEDSEGSRAAIGLGRFIQNPLSEFSAMWKMVALSDPTRGHELLYVYVHPLQTFVGKESLLNEYHRVFVDVVNTVGVDINLAASHAHTSYQLQFVAGLGPVKAKALVDHIRRVGEVLKRQEILSNHFLGPVTYRNAIGFLRVRERDLLRDSALNPLDDTRIHPESYYMAVKMCADANNNSTVDLYDPDKYAFIVEDTMYQSASEIKNREESAHAVVTRRLGDDDIHDSLSELDLQAYAARLEQQQKGPRLLTLESIKKELRYPFFDKRDVLRDPSVEDVFFMINGETRDTLRVGMILPCTLLSESRDFVRVRLESGIRASLRKRFLPNYLQDKNYLRAHGFPKDLVVNAKIMAFQKDQADRYYQVALGCDESSILDLKLSMDQQSIPRYTDVNKLMHDYHTRLEQLVNREPVRDAGDKVDEEDRDQRVRPGSKRKKRQIAHPSYYNVDCKGAIDILKSQPAGEAVFRPSSLGTDHLTLSWKVGEGLYRHFDILEKDKPSEMRLGTRLLIKNDEYEDLDEILARFVGSLNQLVEEVMSHEKFRSGSKEEVYEFLKAAKNQNPRGIPYALHTYTKTPGCFSLSFVPNTQPRTVHLEAKVNGFKFFGQLESPVLKSLQHVIHFFKKNAFASQPSSSSSSSSVKPRDANSKSSSSSSSFHSQRNDRRVMMHGDRLQRLEGSSQDYPKGRDHRKHEGGYSSTRSR